MSQTEAEFEVESIINHKFEEGKYLFEVKWVGYEETTWEPFDNLTGTQEIIDEYLKDRHIEPSIQLLGIKKERSKGIVYFLKKNIRYGKTFLQLTPLERASLMEFLQQNIEFISANSNQQFSFDSRPYSPIESLLVNETGSLIIKTSTEYLTFEEGKIKYPNELYYYLVNHIVLQN